jgi:hypothetical protein
VPPKQKQRTKELFPGKTLSQELIETNEIEGSTRKEKSNEVIINNNGKETLSTTTKTYEIEFTPHAERQFSCFSNEIQKQLEPEIEKLATNPRPNKVKKLKGQKK